MKLNKIKNEFNDISLQKAALSAGFALLLMAIIAPFANFYIIENLIVPGDILATSNLIMASHMLFRIGIFCLLINAVLDIIVAWGFYIIFKTVNKSLSLLTAWFRVVYATILVVALSSLINVLDLLSGAEYLAAFEPEQIHAQVMISINTFYNVWDTGLAIFGLHLLVLGFLVFKSPYFSRILGILVIIASSGYLIDSFGKILIPDYNISIGLFTFIGEVLLIFWLLWRGFKGFDAKYLIH